MSKDTLSLLARYDLEELNREYLPEGTLKFVRVIMPQLATIAANLKDELEALSNMDNLHLEREHVATSNLYSRVLELETVTSKLLNLCHTRLCTMEEALIEQEEYLKKYGTPVYSLWSKSTGEMPVLESQEKLTETTQMHTASPLAAVTTQYGSMVIEEKKL